MKAKFSCMLAAVLLAGCAPSQKDYMKEAEELQRSILTLDTHTDTPMRLWNANYHIDQDNPSGCIDFPKMRQGSLDVESFAVFTSQGGRDTAFYNKAYKRGLETFDKILELPVKYPDLVGIVGCPQDMYDLKAAGKLGILPTIENATLIGDDLGRLKELYDKGARIFGLVHSYHNDICDSSSDKKDPEHNGLSELGERVVLEINRLGGVVDVSHASDSTFFDVVKISKAPIMASHSSVRAVADHNRNFSDQMLEALKENGGVIQICILPDYVKKVPDNPAYKEEYEALRNLYRQTPGENTARRDSIRAEMTALKEKYPDQKIYIRDYVDHIDYVVKKIGEDYVGIGTDFDGGGGIDDCKNASQMIGITAELLKRGYTKEQIEKIWGGNFIRVFNKAIEVAQNLK